MKRLLFAMMALLMLGSCSVDNDTPNTKFELAEITGNDLPDSFRFGESYSINIDYVLPSECNSFAGVDARRAGTSQEERTQIYIGVVTRVNNSTNCDAGDTDIQGSSNFSISIDATEDYTFYFWTGTDGNDQPVYTEIVVPVIERGAGS
ncbi:hypothetical protein [Gramella sp. MAR_2010_147]|uniref:hypothetical protein n=1 Tax=Gramella sp. MAR_2010_147 TaxID=1250205 RepID=UPI00087A737C|nr:hypothetical protein [Gramella sp. MAR_2010_147]SDS39972.1 hypothetical protein SAMN04488553_2170 [Gramella sp. MAR_2010_147]